MENSHIEWTNHTFNPWWGCMKVSEGCKNCYAQTLDNRYNHDNPHWGPNSLRKGMSDAYWKQPVKWNADAAKADIKAKVFCASMADWAEGQDTLKHYPSWLMVHDQRLRLMQVIATTPNLNWLLLTKRIGNVMPLLESLLDPLFMHDVLEDGNKEYLSKYKEAYELLRNWVNGSPPENVWIGTSVENQQAANDRIPHLLQVPAKVRFLSCEPLLGTIDLQSAYPSYRRFGPKCSSCSGNGYYSDNFKSPCPDCKETGINHQAIHWIICGGESGHGARPMHPDWARSLRDQCQAAGTAFFFKQWGEFRPRLPLEVPNTLGPMITLFSNGQLSPIMHPNAELQALNGKSEYLTKVGKKAAGALLDNREYKEFPAGAVQA